MESLPSLAEIASWLSTLGVLPMFLGGWALASLGCPVLLLFTAFSMLAGVKGLLIAFLGLYLATLTIYLFVLFVGRAFGRFTFLDKVKGIASSWLYVGASLIPFWPFVAVCAASRIPLARVYLAILAISTPTLLIFSLATLVGQRIGLSPLWVGLAAAGVTISIAHLSRGWTRKTHGHILVATGLRRGESPR